MGNATTIEWSDATWNPVTGCTKISAGCDHCYAERFSERFRGISGHPFEKGFLITHFPQPHPTANKPGEISMLRLPPLAIGLPSNVLQTTHAGGGHLKQRRAGPDSPAHRRFRRWR